MIIHKLTQKKIDKGKLISVEVIYHLRPSVTPLHKKINGTKYYIGNSRLNINVYKYIEILTRQNKALLVVVYTFLSQIKKLQFI